MKIFGWLKVIIIVYCGIGIALYYLQETFLFHPEKLDSNYAFKFSGKFEELKLAVNFEDSISVVKFFPADSIVKGVVIYYHGNMKNIEHYAPNVQPFLQQGYEVWMPDYPGFGKTTGIRTEQKIYDQAKMVYRLAEASYKSDSIILYGKSFGTGIAAYVASYSPSKALVLETPYYSLTSLFRHYAPIYPVSFMSNYKVPAYEYLQDVRSPVIILHGTGDDVIPYSNAKRLIPYLKPGDRFITIDGGGHNTLAKFVEYKNVIDSLLK